MREIHKLASKTIDATKDNYLSLFEARMLVSPETVGPELDEEESAILEVTYRKLIEGKEPKPALGNIVAETGVREVLSDKIRDGQRERKKTAVISYSTFGGLLVGVSVGLALALTGPAIPIAMALVSVAGGLVGAGVGNGIGRFWSRFI